MAGEIIRYLAEPTAIKFHESLAFVRGLMGPVGSGKSVACVADILMKAAMQEPNSAKKRKSRWVIARNTYPELKSTTIKTWQEWVPSHVCKIKWDPPISGFMSHLLPDGTTVELEVFFIALDVPDDIGKLLSLDLTGAWINEARLIPKSILDTLTGRVGRYPSKRDGGCTWSGIIMDTNPPDDDHWWYRMAEEEHPQGWEFFRQPGALIHNNDSDTYTDNPVAENVQNHTLGYEYWRRQLAGKTKDWIKVYILGEYGTVCDGKPVYPEFSDTRHVAKSLLKPIPGVPLVLGWDFGLTPAVVFCQQSSTGQLLVLDELVAEDMGIRRFVTKTVKPHIFNFYSGFKLESVADPAGDHRAQTEESTCLMELANAGIRTETAPTNEFMARREAVAEFLTRSFGDEPGLLISPNCKVLRRGFGGAYQLERVQTSGEMYRDRPKKNAFSHIHDALQYAALYMEGGNIRKRNKSKRPSKKSGAGGWT